jgi:outer membrane protein OmpA-like peptidoglycan-associated protein
MKNFKIEIPEPCHENWNDMGAAERGRHCALCKKVVVDFSDHTPEQLNKKLREYHDNRTDVCGRFKNEQVSSTPKPKYHTIEFAKLNLTQFQQFVFAFAFAFFLGGFSACKVDKRTMGIPVFYEGGTGPSVAKHLDDFNSKCKGDGSDIRTMGPIVIVPDTATIITVAPLHKLSFEKDSFNLNKESMLFLDQLADSLKKSRNYSVEVIGHTDSTGSIELNKELSLKRATVVKEYLEKKGIKVDTCRGVSYQYPIADNKTEEGRARNRRVEIFVTRKKAVK